MPIDCGSQCTACDYPIHIDTYKGCSHACKYCYVKKWNDISNIQPMPTANYLRKFIAGHRTRETRWCDWDIPLHWGSVSDPFQPCEREYKCSLECLEVFAETGYPFIISTKNPPLLLEEPYLTLIEKCNCVLQVSMACERYDKLEPGAATYKERLEAIQQLSGKVRRAIVRVSPYFPECHKDIIANIPEWRDAGVWGITVSSFVSNRKQKGMKRIGGAYRFDTDILYRRLNEIKSKCHESGIAFMSSEYLLDWLGDSLNCCGCDGLEDFRPNVYNWAHMAYDAEMPESTEAMRQTNTFQPFKCKGQKRKLELLVKNRSFADLMIDLGQGAIEVRRDARDKYENKVK